MEELDIELALLLKKRSSLTPIEKNALEELRFSLPLRYKLSVPIVSPVSTDSTHSHFLRELRFSSMSGGTMLSYF